MAVSVEGLSCSLSSDSKSDKPSELSKKGLSSSDGHDKPDDKPKTVDTVGAAGGVYQNYTDMQEDDDDELIPIFDVFEVST